MDIVFWSSSTVETQSIVPKHADFAFSNLNIRYLSSTIHTFSFKISSIMSDIKSFSNLEIITVGDKININNYEYVKSQSNYYVYKNKYTGDLHKFSNLLYEESPKYIIVW
ncbi:PxORF114 peptide [Plutella xylostella granulovirus]|uniref:ORF112 protein n=1 Tax=Plutella xylostella granulovirus TaxID=98383 RepID=Q9DVR9_9BBAC|nr:PxORF114 peptide [Plutella xylostella granulovirus]AAG27412.1 PxORF114 peptide [Plutella xylostella granulovirus]AMQ35724.1 PxGV-Corf112 protein [Plutella xylostella granulovirus]AMQ35841.1 PxGV-Korf112 protein [Plutella xylostella granulovirus]AMQ35958.1 PxGV-Morf112 protein [Plutella xylostella granulovirus]AMQ36075.1 PxGV-Torf112 protein [Plutella xylostella granulovirus]